MRIAGSFPLLPQRFMVRVETRRREATSETVKRSGKLARSMLLLFVLVSGFWFWLSMSDIQIIRKKVDSQLFDFFFSI